MDPPGTNTRHGDDPAARGGWTQIPGRYLLAIMSIPCYVDAQGQRYFDPLWAKDLALHLAYIKDLTLAMPRIDGDPPLSYLPMSRLPLANLKIVDLPHLPSLRTALKRLPSLALKIWKAIGQADIVHAGVGGWPIPDGWLAIPFARMRRRFVIVIVESDFWRISTPETASRTACIRAAVSEVINRWCTTAANVSFFTHENYKQSLLTRHKERGHVFQASWIDDAIILPAEEAKRQWDEKLRDRRELRLVFAGRLTPDKGIFALLEALALVRNAAGISCDVVGDGSIRAQCEAMAARLAVKVNFLGTVPYGPAFFDLLGRYDALAMPILSNEQPRIVYDAYARAIPSLGFRTDGLASCITDGITGRLCRPGSAAELAALIDWAAGNRDQLATMGMAGLSGATSVTHSNMHKRRAEILAPLIAAHSVQPR